MSTTREVGAEIGIALVGSVFASRYEGGLPDLNRVLAEAATAVTDSAAGGLAVAAKVGGQTGQSLSAGVRDAFISGLSGR